MSAEDFLAASSDAAATRRAAAQAADAYNGFGRFAFPTGIALAATGALAAIAGTVSFAFVADPVDGGTP